MSYTAGWTARKVTKRVNCSTCTDCLTSSVNPNYHLTCVKDRGGLLYPSPDLVKALTFTEKLFRQDLKFDKIVFSVMHVFGKIGTLFTDSTIHFESTVFGISSHYYSLVKLCVETYLKMRFHYKAKLNTMKHARQSRRRTLTKLIHFTHH